MERCQPARCAWLREVRGRLTSDVARKEGVSVAGVVEEGEAEVEGATRWSLTKREVKVFLCTASACRPSGFSAPHKSVASRAANFANFTQRVPPRHVRSQRSTMA